MNTIPECCKCYRKVQTNQEGVCETCARPPRKVYDLTLVVKGVFGRNRNVKFETFKIERREADARFTNEAAIAAAQAKIIEIKLKFGQYKVVEREVEIEGVWERFALFSGERAIASGSV